MYLGSLEAFQASSFVLGDMNGEESVIAVYEIGEFRERLNQMREIYDTFKTMVAFFSGFAAS